MSKSTNEHENLTDEEKKILEGLINGSEEPADSGRLDWPIELQQKLLSGLIHNIEAFKRTHFLDPTYFQDRAQQAIYKITRAYHDRYGALPARDTIEQKLTEMVSVTNPARHYYFAEVDVVYQIPVKGDQLNWLIDTATEFARLQRIRECYSKTLGAIGKNKSWSEVYDILASSTLPFDQKDRSYKFAPSDWQHFMSATHSPEWLVKKVLVKNQPCVVGGPLKALKTSVLADLGISLAGGVPFLGQAEWSVSRPYRTVFISGESGQQTLQETCRRIAKAKGIEGNIPLFPDDRLPSLRAYPITPADRRAMIAN